MGDSKAKVVVSLKDQGNDLFKAGNYLKAAALYTQGIKQDPSNHTLYSNRAAAFLNLVKLSKALADAETTITLKPEWEKGYFRKGCVLEAMERYNDALAAFEIALKLNPQSSEVSRKIKRLSQLEKDKKREVELEKMRSNVDMTKHLDALKSTLSQMYEAAEQRNEIFSFLVETMETAVKTWHETSKVDPRVYFLIDKEKTDTEKYAPVVNIDKAFESPNTHGDCFSYLRQYAEDSFSRAACLVVPKSSISYPQVELPTTNATYNQQASHREEIFNFVVVAIDQIWRARNMLLFGEEALDLNVLSKTINRVAEENWIVQLKKKSNQKRNQEATRWSKPNKGWIKFNCDAAVKDESTCIAWIARNHLGNTVGAYAECYPTISVAEAEAKAIRAALEMGNKLDLRNFCIESDSAIVIDALSNNLDETDRLIKHHVVEIGKICIARPFVRVSKIPRCCNGVAHNLASWAKSLSCCGKIPLSSIPISVFCDPFSTMFEMGTAFD